MSVLVFVNSGVHSRSMRETDWTKILGWPGYRVYRHEINEEAKTLKLWVRESASHESLSVERELGRLW
jgi:hypothetical protein